jgi:hypothetical protein
LAKTLSVPERIKLFKEINRIHRKIYNSRMLYRGAWGRIEYIDIDRNCREGSNGWNPISSNEVREYYFHDDKGKDITLLRRSFAWQAYYFYHLNPYKFLELNKNRLTEGDFISDDLGKKIRPDISHSIHCLETTLNVQQRNDNGMIWVTSGWLYHYDCYGSGEGVRGDIYETFSEVAGGDEGISKKLQAKYEEITDFNRYEFKKALERYFKGEKLQSKYWDGGYLFAASKEWRIKTLEQLDEALAMEEKHFSSTLEEFIGWFRSNGLNLGEKAEESLRRRMRKFYSTYPCNIAKELCKLLVEEDKAEPSDVYLWWGGEPNSDSCYALLTLFFEIDPTYIGTSNFDDRVSRNLRAIINIAEKEHGILSSYREYAPKVWKAVFY